MVTQSEAMFEVLKSNGLKDKSYLYVKDYGDKFKNAKPYNPRFHEKVFGKGFGKSRLTIDINENGLQAFCGSTPVSQVYKEIDQKRLRSIITFFNCSNTKQQTILKYFEQLENIGNEYEFFLNNNWKLVSPLDISFGKIYDAVVI
jgi:hypothetical protein